MTEVVAVEQLKQYLNKIEKLEEQKLQISEEIKDVFTHAKSSGFDIAAIKQVLKIKKSDKTKLAHQEAVLDLYREALGL